MLRETFRECETGVLGAHIAQALKVPLMARFEDNHKKEEQKNKKKNLYERWLTPSNIFSQKAVYSGPHWYAPMKEKL